MFLLALIRAVPYHIRVTDIYQDAPSRNSRGTKSTPSSAARRGRPRSDRVHRAILDAARELLIEEGFAHLRLEHVAARAGVGKATIYRRWDSKEALAQALLADLAAPHISVARSHNTRPSCSQRSSTRCAPSPRRRSAR